VTQPTNIHAPSEDDYIYCIRCGLCLSTCPTYREYLTETASPRGRVALARKALEGELELSPNLFEQMYACFGCLACNEICPVGNCPADLALAMRHVQEQVQPAAWKRPLFRGLIPHPTTPATRPAGGIPRRRREPVPGRVLPGLRPKPDVRRGERSHGSRPDS
jgi:Fe-S oxidoreductase